MNLGIVKAELTQDLWDLGLDSSMGAQAHSYQLKTGVIGGNTVCSEVIDTDPGELPMGGQKSGGEFGGLLKLVCFCFGHRVEVTFSASGTSSVSM